VSDNPAPIEWDCGGLRFAASFRGAGATLRVSGQVDGHWEELLRFDDFIDQPHYHVPASADPIMFDRDAQGEPLAFFVAELRDHLGELLTTAGYGDVAAHVDLRAVTDDAEHIRAAMIDVVPEDGYVRLPGVGLQRVGS
jgi:hypothetical protein